MPSADNVGTGLIFNIQRFSIHDGPGIRTTVFMKGCPLTCHWCSNPESQLSFPNLMARDSTCTVCGTCVDTCPRGAIAIHENKRRIDWAACDQCLRCVESCLYESLSASGKYITVEQALEEVLKDTAFYGNSGGGVTVSGGEPLLQADFVGRLLELCKSEGLHTALDTTGHVPWSAMNQALPHVDLLLFDVKHLDSNEHERRTGVPNKIVLENLERAAGLVKIWLRIPLIVGFNDSEEHMIRVARMGKAVGAEKISLLPYHEGGKTKCEQIGRTYLFADGAIPTDEHVQRLRDCVESIGMPTSVGS